MRTNEKLKRAPQTQLTNYIFKDNVKKKNYQAYNDPEPGDGLLMYRERLTNLVCSRCECNRSHKKHYTRENVTNSLKCRCEHCHLVFPPNNNHFFKIFPPKLKYPQIKPNDQKLSFMDDPPYTDYSEFLSKLKFKEIRFLEKQTNKIITVNKERYNDIDPSYYYCRYRTPRWVQ